MGYRVEYQSVKKLRNREKSRNSTAAMTGVFFLMFLILTYFFWPEGREVLREWLLPGDVDVTAAAMDSLARDLRSGHPLGETLGVFCRSILDGAGLGTH